MTLSNIELQVWNKGERLIPGITHNAAESQRHKSSYDFFRRVIQHDIDRGHVSKPTILDVGFGCGFGCGMLAEISGAKVTGIDIGEECLEYASENYSAKNIKFKLADITTFLNPDMKEYDYIVSRGVLEHIANGLDVVVNANWKQRILFDVPYAEPRRRNSHHLLTNITEKDFDRWSEAEIFFEDIQGRMFDRGSKPPKPNMIMGALKRDGIETVSSIFSYPIEPVAP